MRLPLFILLAFFAVLAAAQLRSVPPEAKRGAMTHKQDMIVTIDGKDQRLSPGAQIRDTDNRLVLPVALPPKSDVKYLVDAVGNVHRVWILSKAESVQADKEKPKPPPKKEEKKKDEKKKDEKKDAKKE